jgi:UDP-N-acetylglucosamine--N-acetylmuramyl-(pentapeptide) pyrophosphoryl-undecaprenol N-acetylglucosamine transferase
MKVVISGGGTAGHVTPGLALGRELAGRGHEVSFVGTDRGVETRMVPAAGFELHVVASRPLVRRISPEAVRAVGAALGAVGECGQYVGGAAAVVGMGGYASVPAALSARRQRVPLVLHDQNAIPGLANRALSRIARPRAVAVSFREAAGRFPRRIRTVLTGNPVREDVLRVRTERGALAGEARSTFGLQDGRRTLAVFGGSLGALNLHRAAVAACGLLRDRSDLQVVLITGPEHLESISRAWPPPGGSPSLLLRVEGFVDRMDLIYAAADLVIARGGASSVAEIAALGIPSLLVPYPHAAAGEQLANARALQRAGGASVMLDVDVTGETLCARIVNMIDHPERLAAMASGALSFGRPDAAACLADLVEESAA